MTRHGHFIYIANGAKGVLVRPSQIRMLEISGNYLRISLEGDKSIMIRCTMRKCQQELDPEIFFPANRQCVVNLGYVQEASPLDGKRLLFRLTNGKEIPLSCSRTLQFRKQFSL